MIEKTPRGIRNNNPLNIRIGNNWKGERESQNDPQFEQFKSMTFGLRAAFILLRNYIKKYRLDTIQKIISRWAPDNENNTEDYVRSVCDHMQTPPNRTLRFEEKNYMCMLVSAMCRVECGQPVSMQLIETAYEMAKSS